MADPTGFGEDIDQLVDLVSDEETDKQGSRRSLLLVLLLLLLLCAVTTVVDVWVERTPEQRESIARNLECLQCHTELIPELSKASVHDPFLNEDCTTCHSPHGEEVTVRLYAGSWKRWEQVRTVIEWVPLKFALEAFDSIAGVTDEGGGGELLSESVTEEKGEESVFPVDETELCWICHGDLAAAKKPLPHQHSPFDKGFCTDCHNPHASDVRVLLKREEKDLCPSCHPMFDELGREQLHPPYEGRFCTNCHDPHASNYTGVLVTNQRDLCFTCHPTVAPLSLKPVQHNPFYFDSCTGCHEPHGSDTRPLLIEDQPPLCYNCHPGIEKDFLKASRHPVGTLQLNCADCHNPHAADYSFLLAARNNDMCYQCHEEARGDAYAVKASYELSAHKGQLCIRCHTPHGSEWTPILRDSNPDLCLQCHLAYDADHLHPVRPVDFDVKADKGLTCTSTCHNPHGTQYNRMLIGFYWPADGFCMQCHTRVGIDF